METDLHNPVPIADLVVANVRPNGGPLTNVLVRNGRIASLGPAKEVSGGIARNASGR
jgi:hypothetical protein